MIRDLVYHLRFMITPKWVRSMTQPIALRDLLEYLVQVIGNDAAITIGGQSGNFELNVMLPMIADNLLSSLDLLSNVTRLLADKAIATFTVNEDQLQLSLSRNPILVTALNPIIGYLKAHF